MTQNNKLVTDTLNEFSELKGDKIFYMYFINIKCQRIQ